MSYESEYEWKITSVNLVKGKDRHEYLGAKHAGTIILCYMSEEEYYSERDHQILDDYYPITGIASFYMSKKLYDACVEMEVEKI